MVKKIIAFSLIFILLLPSLVFADVAAYKLSNGRISVSEEVFNQLVTNDKLLEEYKKELETYKQTMSQLKVLEQQKDDIQQGRIDLLKNTIEFKDQIITNKDSNIKEYENLYKSTKKELAHKKTMSFIEKCLIIGLTSFAISKMDDSGAKIGVGAGVGATLLLGEFVDSL